MGGIPLQDTATMSMILTTCFLPEESVSNKLGWNDTQLPATFLMVLG